MFEVMLFHVRVLVIKPGPTIYTITYYIECPKKIYITFGLYFGPVHFFLILETCTNHLLPKLFAYMHKWINDNRIFRKVNFLENFCSIQFYGLKPFQIF